MTRWPLIRTDTQERGWMWLCRFAGLSVGIYLLVTERMGPEAAAFCLALIAGPEVWKRDVKRQEQEQE